MGRLQLYIKGLILGPLLVGLLFACGRTPPAVRPPETQSISLQTPPRIQTSPVASPSPTPQPLAAEVNGEALLLAEYQAEIAQLQAARGGGLLPDDPQHALDNLIDQTLLAQGAAEQGFRPTAAEIQERLNRLRAQAGGEASFSAWMQANGYDESLLTLALGRASAAAWMRDYLAGQVPTQTEQVHARQILLYTAVEAEQVLAQLKAGNDFGNLAARYDPLTRGDLGWFPRGYLLDPRLEETVFALQVGEFSGIVETLAGYHIVQLLERQADRPLSPEALLVLQARAIQDWLRERRQRSQIVIHVPLSTPTPAP